jgi:hypothetical protein
VRVKKDKVHKLYLVPNRCLIKIDSSIPSGSIADTEFLILIFYHGKIMITLVFLGVVCLILLIF